jgi:hypothetical protein
MWRGAVSLGGYDYWSTGRRVADERRSGKALSRRPEGERLSQIGGQDARRGILIRMRFDHVAHQVPDISGAIAWWRDAVGDVEVLYEDATWALIDVSGLRLAFVMADEHPGHVAFRVAPERLDAMAAEHGTAPAEHRDGSRSFYVDGPGETGIEIIAYPVEDEDAE